MVNGMRGKIDVAKAVRLIAKREGITVEAVRREMSLAMRVGLCSQNPKIQARWKKVPCRGKVPTPEELIAYLAANIDAGRDLIGEKQKE